MSDAIVTPVDGAWVVELRVGSSYSRADSLSLRHPALTHTMWFWLGSDELVLSVSNYCCGYTFGVEAGKIWRCVQCREVRLDLTHVSGAHETLAELLAPDVNSLVSEIWAHDAAVQLELIRARCCAWASASGRSETLQSFVGSLAQVVTMPNPYETA